MALLSCSECGRKVSSRAKACQSCGAPPPRVSHMLIGYAVLIVIAFSLIGSCARALGV